MAIDAQTLFEQGKKLLDEDNYEAAANTLQQAIKIQPNVADYYAWLALAFLNLQQDEQALTQADKAISLDKNCGTAYRARGHIHFGSKRFSTAIQDYTGAIELDAKDQRAYRRRGNAYHDLGDSVNAIRDYTRAIELDPKDSDVYVWRYEAYIKTNQFEKALSDKFHYHELVDLKTKADIMEWSDSDEWLRAVKSHFRSVLLPRLGVSERYISSIPCYLEWGKQSEIRSSTSSDSVDIYTFTTSSFGSGYVAVTNENIHIISLGQISQKNSMYKTGILWGAISSFFHEKTELEKTDQFWTVSSRNIIDIQTIMGKAGIQRIHLTTPTVTWEIVPLYTADYQYIFTGLRMAADGKFKKVAASQNVTPTQQSPDNIELIKKLSELKNAGVITEAEFEQKKQEILKRI